MGNNVGSLELSGQAQRTQPRDALRGLRSERRQVQHGQEPEERAQDRRRHREQVGEAVLDRNTDSNNTDNTERQIYILIKPIPETLCRVDARAALSRCDDLVCDDDLEDVLDDPGQVAHHEHDHDRGQRRRVVRFAPEKKSFRYTIRNGTSYIT